MMRPLPLLRFLGYYLGYLAMANVDVTRRVLRPGTVAPAIVRVPVHTDSHWRLVVFAHVLSLTPGSLTLDIAQDASAVFVHVIDGSSPEETRAQLGRLETRLLEALRT